MSSDNNGATNRQITPTIIDTHAGTIECRRVRPTGSATACVMVHHGLIGASGIPDAWADAAIERGIDLISASRPGYGESPPIEMTAVADWAPIATDLADSFEWDRFAVLAVSAGACYGYAVAAHLPERVSAVAAMSGVPYVLDPAIIGLHSEEERAYYDRFANNSAEDVRNELNAFFAQWVSTLEPDDPARAALAEALTFDGRGPTREVRLQIRPWGFRLDDVEQPVRLWHHRDDYEVPYESAKLMLGHFPHASLTEQVAEPLHGPSDGAFADALDWLVGHQPVER